MKLTEIGLFLPQIIFLGGYKSTFETPETVSECS